jgi:hypothetical protein
LNKTSYFVPTQARESFRQVNRCNKNKKDNNNTIGKQVQEESSSTIRRRKIIEFYE